MVAALVVDCGSGTCYANFAGVDSSRTAHTSVVVKPKTLGVLVGVDQKDNGAATRRQVQDARRHGRYGPELDGWMFMGGLLVTTLSALCCFLLLSSHRGWCGQKDSYAVTLCRALVDLANGMCTVGSAGMMQYALCS